MSQNVESGHGIANIMFGIVDPVGGVGDCVEGAKVVVPYKCEMRHFIDRLSAVVCVRGPVLFCGEP